MICITNRFGVHKAVHRDGELIGWNLYRKGIFGTLCFIGRTWIK